MIKPTNIEYSKYLSFRLGREQFSLAISYIQEIRNYEPPTEIANTPNYIKGLIFIRERMVPIIDLRLKFKFTEIRYDDTTIILLINRKKKLVGLVVDEIFGVVDISQGQIKKVPDIASRVGCPYITGLVSIGAKTMLLLDIDLLIET